MALDRRRGVGEGIGRGLVVGNGVGQLYRARVGERDVEIGLRRRQRATRMPEQVAERPLAEAGPTAWALTLTNDLAASSA